MASKTERKRRGAGNKRRQHQNNVFNPELEALKLLQLDLRTLIEQIRLLDDELESDPCLTAAGIAAVLEMADTLKQELQEARNRIAQLKGLTAA